jgi:hypothetical protein
MSGGDILFQAFSIGCFATIIYELAVIVKILRNNKHKKKDFGK